MKNCIRNITLAIIACTCSLFFNERDAQALCIARPDDGSFENQLTDVIRRPWIVEGSGGIDRNRGLSQSGRNNAWIRSNTGWNGIRQAVRLNAGDTYTLMGFVRTSGNVQDGYFGFRDSSQRPVSEIKYGPLTSYTQLRVQYRPTVSGTYYIFTGIWALNQDSWAQIDNFRLEFPCRDTEENGI
jgi:hypothetical protein